MSGGTFPLKVTFPFENYVIKVTIYFKRLCHYQIALEMLSFVLLFVCFSCEMSEGQADKNLKLLADVREVNDKQHTRRHQLLLIFIHIETSVNMMKLFSHLVRL